MLVFFLRFLLHNCCGSGGGGVGFHLFPIITIQKIYVHISLLVDVRKLIRPSKCKNHNSYKKLGHKVAEASKNTKKKRRLITWRR